MLVTSKIDTISKSRSYVQVNRVTTTSLIDTGWSDCYVGRKCVEKNSFSVQNYMGEVTLVEMSVKLPIINRCLVNLKVKNNDYENIPFHIRNNLFIEIIIFERFLKKF